MTFPWQIPLETMFSLLPTPLVRLAGVSADTGVEVYCKRDDLTGFGGGGNKVRKIDFLMAQARAEGADSLVAVGGIQSNFCRVVAAAGAAAGMTVHLVLGGGGSEPASGNVLLDHLFGARIETVASADWNEWEAVAHTLARTLQARGQRVFAMPVGGSTVTGVWGYARAFMEIIEQAGTQGVEFSTMVHASSSGGTQAGLVVGQSASGWPGRIVGMGVAKRAGDLAGEVMALAQSAASLAGVTVSERQVIVDDACQGPGYAIPTQEAQAAITYFARREGLLLDNVYSGKAAAGLLAYIRSGRFRQGERVLFIHTGGTFELFATHP